MEIRANHCVIARVEMVAVDGNYGVRIWKCSATVYFGRKQWGRQEKRMIVVPHLSPTVLFLMVTTGFGACVGAVVAARVKSKRRRSRRVLAIHVRLETEWQNARMRMYLSGPIGPARMLVTKYSNDLPNADLVR
jgi:hypothetical protein